MVPVFQIFLHVEGKVNRVINFLFTFLLYLFISDLTQLTKTIQNYVVS